MKKLFITFILVSLVLPAAVIAQTPKITATSKGKTPNTTTVDMNSAISNSGTNGDTGPGLNSGSGMNTGPSMGAGSTVSETRH